MLTAILALLLMQTPPTELSDYVSRRDETFKWRVDRETRNDAELSIVSQTWQGRPWRHSLAIVQPSKLDNKDTILLVVTGDRRDSDIRDGQALADRSGMAVATLFDVPNQPLWDLREDALIAHTFSKFLETGDASWPLLFPMTKSVVRAIDVLEKHTKVSKFVVTGMSKRGWTTWMAGALGDKRIVGLAPMIYDNLNIPAQLKHQLESWGKYSEMIEDYTSRGLQDTLGSDEGKRLARIIDPYSYRSKITALTLVITGSNDPYWTADAHKLYWADLSQPRWQLVLPNTGHGPGVGDLYTATLAAFARSRAGEFKMPQVSWSVAPGEEAGTYVVKASSEDPPAVQMAVWTATAPSKDLRSATWSVVATATATAPPKVIVAGTPLGRFAPVVKAIVKQDKAVAALIEQRFDVGGYKFSLFSPVNVLNH